MIVLVNRSSGETILDLLPCLKVRGLSECKMIDGIVKLKEKRKQTGRIEQVMHQGDRRTPLKSMVGSINGSQKRRFSLNKAASTLTVDDKLI